MKNADKPITPFEYEERQSGSPSYHTKAKYMHTGLTKREHFAGLAMQGILASNQQLYSFEDAIPKLAIMYADKLLEFLENTGA